MPLGAKIGVAVGLVGGLVGIGIAVLTLTWRGGAGGPSETCVKAANCCRRMAGMSSASSTCDGYTKQGGPMAEKLCEEHGQELQGGGVLQIARAVLTARGTRRRRAALDRAPRRR